MLATFMGSAHTRHNRRKGHGLTPRLRGRRPLHSLRASPPARPKLRIRSVWPCGSCRSAGFAGARAARTPLCSAAGRVPAGRLPLVAVRRTPGQLLRYSAARQVPAGRLPLVAARRTPDWLLRLLRVTDTRTLPLVAIGCPSHSAQATTATVCYPDRPERSPRTVCSLHVVTAWLVPFRAPTIKAT